MNLTSSIEIAPGISKTSECTEASEASEYIMAVTLCPDRLPVSGIARVIKNRRGDVAVPGVLDHSELHYVSKIHSGRWEIGAPVNFSGLEELVKNIKPKNTEFVGLEDPDTVIGPDDTTHLYFTIPFIGSELSDNFLFLGHAKGDMNKLEMQEPVLKPFEDTDDKGQYYTRGFKELCPSPSDSNGTCHHLVESNNVRESTDYSTVAMVNAKSLDGPWEFVKDVIHPAELKTKYSEYSKNDNDYEWCGEHASPCRLIPEGFVDSGNYKIGILNGREKSKNGVYGKFRPGLFLYDSETGEVPWVDPLPLFDDPDARNIIFASDLAVNETINNSEKSITLMTHIDDSYLQDYQISASTIKNRLPVF